MAVRERPILHLDTWKFFHKNCPSTLHVQLKAKTIYLLADTAHWKESLGMIEMDSTSLSDTRTADQVLSWQCIDKSKIKATLNIFDQYRPVMKFCGKKMHYQFMVKVELCCDLDFELCRNRRHECELFLGAFSDCVFTANSANVELTTTASWLPRSTTLLHYTTAP